MRCIEDYDERSSHIKTDFYRKWYHTRWRYRTISLEQLIDAEYENSGAISSLVRDVTAGFEEQACERADAQRFYASLSPKDQEILKLRTEGYTYQEVADHLGFKTHSAVQKRVAKMVGQYYD